MQRFWKKNTHWGRDFIKDALRRGNEGRHKESVDTVGWIVSLAAKLMKNVRKAWLENQQSAGRRGDKIGVGEQKKEGPCSLKFTDDQGEDVSQVNESGIRKYSTS